MGYNKFKEGTISQIYKKKLFDLQNKLFLINFNHHFTNCKEYRSLLEYHNVSPEQINSINDISKLPIIDGDTILKKELISVNKNEIKRVFQTSGTTGKPKLFYYNHYDKKNFTTNQAKVFLQAGIKKGDTLLCAASYGPWASGLSIQDAGELIGPTIAADPRLDINWHLWALQAHKPVYMCCLPSFLPKLEEALLKNQKDPAQSTLKKIFLFGEISSKKFRDHFKQVFKADVLNMYCNTEFGCINQECEYGNLHYFSDKFYIQIVDPITKKELPKGECGEIIITGLNRQTMPLIRYNTHDLGYIIPKQCKCQSPHPMISHIQGRSDHMITIGGANVYPIHIENAMATINEITPFYKFIVEKEDFKDKVTIQVELKKEFEDQKEKLRSIIIDKVIKSSDGLDFVVNQTKNTKPFEVQFFKSQDLSKGKGKIIKRYDKREKK